MWLLAAGCGGHSICKAPRNALFFCGNRELDGLYGFAGPSGGAPTGPSAVATPRAASVRRGLHSAARSRADAARCLRRCLAMPPSRLWGEICPRPPAPRVSVHLAAPPSPLLPSPPPQPAPGPQSAALLSARTAVAHSRNQSPFPFFLRTFCFFICPLLLSGLRPPIGLPRGAAPSSVESVFGASSACADARACCACCACWRRCKWAPNGALVPHAPPRARLTHAWQAFRVAEIPLPVFAELTHIHDFLFFLVR